MGVLAHHPELTTAYNQLIRHALYFTTMTPRQRELLVLPRGPPARGGLRVGPARLPGRRGGPRARRGRAGPRRTRRRRDGRRSSGRCSRPPTSWWPTPRIGEATYAALSAELDTQQMMDVVFTVGAYEVFAMAMRTFDVELDDDLQPYA